MDIWINRPLSVDCKNVTVQYYAHYDLYVDYKYIFGNDFYIMDRPLPKYVNIRGNDYDKTFEYGKTDYGNDWMVHHYTSVAGEKAFALLIIDDPQGSYKKIKETKALDNGQKTS